MINILSALSFFLLPVLIGRAFTAMKNKSTASFSGVDYFIRGALVLFILALAEKYFVLNLFPAVSFISLFRITVLIISIIALGLNLFTQETNPFSRLKNYLLPIIISLLLAGTVFYLWQLNTPYSLNWDFLEHQTLVNNILQNRFSFATTNISDTFGFNGYSSIFHLLLTVAQMFFSVSIIGFWNTISFVHLFLVIISAYFLALVITNDELVALLSAILSAFVFETITFTNLFFLPQTLTAVIFILVLIQLLQAVKQNRLPPINLILINSLFLFLNHYIIGFICLSIYILTYLYFRFEKEIKSKYSFFSLLETGLILTAVFLVLSPLLPLATLNFGEAQYYTFSLMEKWAFFKQAYGYSLLIFLPVGIIAVFKKKQLHQVLVLLIATVLLILVLSGIPYAFKFFVVGRFFVNLIIALGIASLIDRIKIFSLQNLALSWVVVIFSVILVTNALIWKNRLNYQNTTTLISPNEVAASVFLKENYEGKSVLLISDPATQNILEGLSGINSAGGVYASQNTREQLIKINTTDNPVEIKTTLNKITDRLTQTMPNRLFILSGRYFLWQREATKQKQSFNFNVWTPYDLTLSDYQYIFNLVDSNNFKLIYQNPTLVILESI